MNQQLRLTVLLTLAAAHLFGQISLSNSYFPEPGDTLKTATDLTPSGITITPAGGDQVWDFTDLQPQATLERTVLAAAAGQGSAGFPSADVLVEQFNGAEGYYHSTDNAFSIIGYFGQDPLGQGIEISAPFAPAYTERWAPLDFLDLNLHESALLFAVAADDIPGNIFDSLEISPDSVRIRVATNRTDLVDAWGNLSIPGGTYDVLREKRIEYRDVRLDAKIGGLPWFDVTDIAIAALPIEELGRDTVTTYHFWSPDAKEPIAVITADASGENVESVSFKNNQIISNATVAGPAKPSVNVFPNPAINWVQFDFANLPRGTYRVELYNLLGVSIWSKSYPLAGSHSERIQLNGFRPGLYIYAVTGPDGHRLLTRRLLVGRP